MISIEIPYEPESDFSEMIFQIQELELDGTLAIVKREEKGFEIEAENGRFVLYTTQRNEAGEYETVDKDDADFLMDEVTDFESFVNLVLRLVL